MLLSCGGLRSRGSLISALQARTYGHFRFRANQDLRLELSSEPCGEHAVCRIAIRIFASIVTPIDFKGWGSQGSQSCAGEQKNYEMNKCLSLVHLTSRIGSQSSGSDESTSWFLSCPKPDLDPPGTKSVSGRLTLIAAAPCSALRLNFRAGNHLPRTPQLRLPTSSG